MAELERAGYSTRASRILGTNPVAFQWEVTNETENYSVLRVAPKTDVPDTVAYVPLEATLSLYLSRKRWFDCFADISLNRLYDVNEPVLVTYLRGDGAPVPRWEVAFKKDAGAEISLLFADPDSGDYRIKARAGSFAQKLTETENPDGLIEKDDSGDYYVDGTTAGIPVAENGIISTRMNPYSTSSGVQIYQSIVDRTHRYIRIRTAGVWGAWGLVTVA